MRTLKTLILGYLLIALTACSDDDNNIVNLPTPINEEEVITTVIATLSPQGGGTDITLTSRDLDGDGPNAPVITVSGDLTTTTTYNGTITLTNETESPAEDITTEVSDEGADHQFFFTSSVGIVAYTDADVNGAPIGLNFTLDTSAATTGNLTIILRHEPNKSATDVSNGDITNAGGETDVEVTFTGIVIQ